MQRMYRYLCSLLLGAALVAPISIQASAFPLERRDDRDRDKDKDKGKHKHKRYYDRDRKDYHDWDDREDRAYRHWLLEERHERFREFGRLRREQQADYWKWRHEHPDWDKDRDRH